MVIFFFMETGVTKFKNKYTVEFAVPAKKQGLLGLNVYKLLEKNELLKNKLDRISAIGIKLTPKTVDEFCSKETMQSDVTSEFMVSGDKKELLTVFVVSENNVILTKDKEVVINHITGEIVEDNTNVNGSNQLLFKFRVTLTHTLQGIPRHERVSRATKTYPV